MFSDSIKTVKLQRRIFLFFLIFFFLDIRLLGKSFMRWHKKNNENISNNIKKTKKTRRNNALGF